ncbi:unnamed protein product [Alopecurus aequalis]
MTWRKKSGSVSSSAGVSACHNNEREKAPRGYVPMVTGSGERVLVPVRLLGAPCIAELLDKAAEQYGYRQPGVLRIPGDAGQFQRLIDCAVAESRLGARHHTDLN